MGRIGETLKKARELREINLREISDATKINIRYLEAIETNQFDALPGGVFNKGFIRAYANYIGLDGQAMVDNYVHDIEAGTDDGADPEPAPSGMHRPTEIPQRRSAPLDSDGAQSARNSSQAPAPLHLTALQDVPSAEAEDFPAAEDQKVLPRIAWLMVATGLLFVILASWKYLGDTPPAPVAAQQAQTPRPTPATDSGEERTQQGSAITAPAEDEAPSRDSEVIIAAPQIIPAARTTDESMGTEEAQPASSDADDTTSASASETAPPAGTEVNPIPPPESEPLPAGQAGRGMTMVITARAATRVRVICDGREAADREMNRGEVESLRCERLIRLSAPDAASIRLAINGSACQPLGAPGSRLFGYVIRADDYRTLCPDPMEGADATR